MGEAVTDLFEGILEIFAEHTPALDGPERRGFRHVVRVLPPRMLKPRSRETDNAEQRARRAEQVKADPEAARARWRAESKAKRARVGAAIRALRDARALAVSRPPAKSASLSSAPGQAGAVSRGRTMR